MSQKQTNTDCGNVNAFKRLCFLYAIREILRSKMTPIITEAFVHLISTSKPFRKYLRTVKLEMRRFQTN
ncbi:hypothetical protein L596_005016 [Steinernema carpocapsae]|uniref:Uncharacterized protein n=1 Tax=Steinernema carpocapsae TaxID=34508 RepID=A0A4U8UXK9_STECR|nr:hypothetical protein L596_005016 [Steinernema carpocapsae]